MVEPIPKHTIWKFKPIFTLFSNYTDLAVRGLQESVYCVADRQITTHRDRVFRSLKELEVSSPTSEHYWDEDWQAF